MVAELKHTAFLKFFCVYASALQFYVNLSIQLNLELFESLVLPEKIIPFPEFLNVKK